MELENFSRDDEEVISFPVHEKQLVAVALCKRFCDPNDIPSVFFLEYSGSFRERHILIAAKRINSLKLAWPVFYLIFLLF